MTYSYSLAAKFCSEFVGMTFTIFLGEGILANELLPSTKGHGMGLLAVALGFGLAFGVNIAWFGAISAHLNPAMFFFLACLDKLQDGWTEFVVGSVASFLGAFVGACGVYVFFAPHFALLPAPPDDDPTTTLVHGTPNALETNAGRISSAFGHLSRKPPDTSISKEFRSMFTGTGSNTNNTPLRKEYDVSQRQALLEKMEICHQRRVQFRPTFAHQQDETKEESDHPLLERRHSVQVAALLHTHDQPVSTTSSTRSAPAEEMEGGQLSSSPSLAKSTDHDDNNNSNNMATPTVVPPNNNDDDNNNRNLQHTNANNTKTDAQIAYEAALQADAHAKLAIFATRPALYNRPLNFLQEVLATCMLVMGAELFNLRLEFDTTTTTRIINKDGCPNVDQNTVGEFVHFCAHFGTGRNHWIGCKPSARYWAAVGPLRLAGTEQRIVGMGLRTVCPIGGAICWSSARGDLVSRSGSLVRER